MISPINEVNKSGPVSAFEDRCSIEDLPDLSRFIQVEYGVMWEEPLLFKPLRRLLQEKVSCNSPFPDRY